MKTIVLIGCGKSKVEHRTRADQLYIGTLFKSSLAYAHTLSADAIYILSALHGVVELDKELAPYNKTLAYAKKSERQAWGAKTLNELRQVSDLERDHFIFLAGQNYRSSLIEHIRSYETPLKGLGIGKQLAWLKTHASARKN